ncbi:MAG: Imm32 family immunity protein [Pseudomonadota bacterium]
MLTFELSDSADELHIHLDEDGLRKLVEAIGRLAPGDHEQFMTPRWGGTELTEQTQSDTTTLLNKVTMHHW